MDNNHEKREHKRSLKYWEAAKRLNPIDDVMFRKMAENKDFCEEILRAILEDKNLTVIEATPQWTGNNLRGRSVILDTKCVIGNGTQIDIEVQKSDNDDHQRRVRYNGAVLTTNLTVKGTMFKDIPNVCIVYISRFDVFDDNFSFFYVDRVVRETRKLVDNGFYEVYVNAKVRDGSDVSELMEIFTDDSTYNPKFPITSETKKHYKNDEGGIETMCDIMQELIDESNAEVRKEGMEEGKKKGRAEEREQIISQALRSGNSAEAVASFLQLPVEDVKRVKDKMNKVTA